MLMGEYDFTDNFVGEQTFWLSKLLFVAFVIDMSVVLMNLVLGLAVNDVDQVDVEVLAVRARVGRRDAHAVAETAQEREAVHHHVELLQLRHRDRLVHDATDLLQHN